MSTIIFFTKYKFHLQKIFLPYLELLMLENTAHIHCQQNDLQENIKRKV